MLKVFLSVRHRAKRTLSARTQTARWVDTIRGVSMWGTRIRGPFPSDDYGCSATDTLGFRRNGIPEGFERWGTRIRGPFRSKSHRSAGNKSNQVLGIRVFLWYVGAGNMNLLSERLENHRLTTNQQKSQSRGNYPSLLIEKATEVLYSRLL